MQKQNASTTAVTGYTKLPSGGYLVENLEQYIAAGQDFFESSIGTELRSPQYYPAVVYFTLGPGHGSIAVPGCRITMAVVHYSALKQEIDILRSSLHQEQLPELKKGITMNDFDLKRIKLTSALKIGGIAILAVAIIPTVFKLSLMALGSVAAISACVVIGLIGVHFMEVLSMKMANLALKAMKNEARANPIETAENRLLEMSKQLDVYQNETATYIAKGQSLIEDVAEMQKTDPEGAASYTKDIENYHAECALREKAIKDAVINLEEARTKIDRARRRWNMNLKHSAFTSSNKEAAATLDQIIIDEALSVVMENAHKATAAMRVDNIAAKARTDYLDAKRLGIPKQDVVIIENDAPKLKIPTQVNR